jgi:hypothetical protein
MDVLYKERDELMNKILELVGETTELNSTTNHTSNFLEFYKEEVGRLQQINEQAEIDFNSSKKLLTEEIK